MGSGKLLTKAIKRYGLENFQQEILFIFNSELEMNDKEKEIVTEDFCKSQSTYNLNPGGKGGFGFINMNEPLRKKKNKIAMKRAKENGLLEKQRAGHAAYLNDTNKVKIAGKKRVQTLRERYGENLPLVDKAYGNDIGYDYTNSK